jgi:hypothetical protein
MQDPGLRPGRLEPGKAAVEAALEVVAAALGEEAALRPGALQALLQPDLLRRENAGRQSAVKVRIHRSSRESRK